MLKNLSTTKIVILVIIVLVAGKCAYNAYRNSKAASTVAKVKPGNNKVIGDLSDHLEVVPGTYEITQSPGGLAHLPLKLRVTSAVDDSILSKMESVDFKVSILDDSGMPVSGVGIFDNLYRTEIQSMLAKGEGEVIIDFTTSGYDALEDAEKCKKFSITAVWIKKYVSSGSSSNASSEASLGTVISESEVKIGNQVWMSTNLDTDTFQNGDPIPQAQNDDEWKLAGEKKQPIWAYYDYDDSNGPKYGKLYNWYAVRDKRKIAPKGWHVASYAEWKQLVDFLGGYKVAGKKLKSSSGWSQNGSGTNDSGFSAVPAGIFHFYGGGQMMLEFTQWWTTTPYNTDQAQAPSLDFDNDQVIFFLPRRDYGFSVRCIKD